jgi:nicotinamide-nucleotide amidase
MQDYSDATLYQLTQQLAQALQSQGLRLVTAESCTGGWLAKCCTDLPGSSNWFEGGIVSYSNRIKQQHLDVKLSTLEQFGAVSEQTVIEMASGAINKFDADIAVAISGIAGPDGGSAEKPVGTVCFAWADKQSVFCNTFFLHGNREFIRRQAVFIAFDGLVKKLASTEYYA